MNWKLLTAFGMYVAMVSLCYYFDVTWLLWILLFWVIGDIRQDITLWLMFINENKEKIDFLEEQKDKLWDKVSSYEKITYELEETKAKLSDHILKYEYKDWWNIKTDPSKKFRVLESYWVHKNFGDIDYNSALGREKYNAFSFICIKDEYMIIKQKDTSNKDEYWSFKKAFIDIAYDEYVLFVPESDENKYYDEQEINNIMEGIK